MSTKDDTLKLLDEIFLHDVGPEISLEAANVLAAQGIKVSCRLLSNSREPLNRALKSGGKLGETIHKLNAKYKTELRTALSFPTEDISRYEQVEAKEWISLKKRQRYVAFTGKSFQEVAPSEFGDRSERSERIRKYEGMRTQHGTNVAFHGYVLLEKVGMHTAPHLSKLSRLGLLVLLKRKGD